jgi:hypothetical protein
MKKHFIISILLLFAIASYGQLQYDWNFRLKLPHAGDTVVQPPLTSILPDISAYRWSVTVEGVGLNDSVIISIGGSNKMISATTGKYKFESFPSTVLPYTFIMDSTTRNTTNGTTTYQKTFPGKAVPYGFARPMFYLDKKEATAGYLNVYFHYNY